ncbi:MAG: ATP-binding cassette domain-containing protein [Eubacteriales bacterium]|nr:ATP-binding cassette domain-containing protein [Eubacteriales bacterium]
MEYKETFLSIDCEEKSYKGKVLLKDVRISFPSHGLFLLYGPNGCGKTTLLSLLSGLDSSFKGKLLFEGQEVGRHNRNSYFDDHVTLVPQDSLVFDDLSVIDNILVSFDRKDRKKAEAVLKEFGLQDCIESPTASLSGGEKQRLAIARSFYHLKDIVLFDESTAFLDKGNREILFAEIQKISQDHLVLFVTHEDFAADALSVNGILRFENGTVRLEKKEHWEEDERSLPTKKISRDKPLLSNIRRFSSFHIVASLFLFLFSFVSIVFGNLYYSLSEKRIQDITYQNYLNTVNAYYLGKEEVEQPEFTLETTVESLSDGNEIGSSIVGIFSTDSFENSGIVLSEGRYPKSSSELLLSSYCYQQLEKEGAFTPFSISILSSPYQVVGIYQGKDLSLYEKRKALLQEERIASDIHNSLLRYSYSFGIESAFRYQEKQSGEEYYLPAKKENQALLKREIIEENLLATPNNCLVNMNDEGRIPFDSNFFYGDQSYLLFARVGIGSILALSLVLSLAFYNRYRRSFLLLRVGGVARKRLTSDVLLSFTFTSLLAYLLSLAGSFLTTYLLQSAFRKQMSFLTSSLFLNHPLFYLLSLLALLLGLGILAWMLYVFLSPKDNRKQLEEVKKK